MGGLSELNVGSVSASENSNQSSSSNAAQDDFFNNTSSAPAAADDGKMSKDSIMALFGKGGGGGLGSMMPQSNPQMPNGSFGMSNQQTNMFAQNGSGKRRIQ